jgi:hypothetical protein
MQLTYADPTHTIIQAVLADAEKLGDLKGPCVTYIPTDGASAACRAIWAQGLAITDPLDGDAVTAAQKEMLAAQEKAAKMTPEEREKAAAEPPVQAETIYPPGSPVSIYPQPGDFPIKQPEDKSAPAKNGHAVHPREAAKTAHGNKKTHSGR